jgi:hypothetical protein
LQLRDFFTFRMHNALFERYLNELALTTSGPTINAIQ